MSWKAFLFLAVGLAPIACPQTTTTTGSSGSGGTGVSGGATPSTGRTGSTLPTTPQTSNAPTYEVPRPIFISGTVTTDDGSPVPPNIVIQRVCSGTAKSVAYADSRGRFNFQWGQNTGMISDASEGASSRRNASGSGAFGNAQSAGGGGMQADPFGSTMMNCDLRASIVGYRSEVLSLFSRNSLDNPDIGTILIHRLANVEGVSVSATSLMAPKDAKKAYEHGLQLLLKNKNEEAGKDFEKAVTAYPKYAEAWMNLGKTRILRKSFEPGREALLKALEADPKLVSPYVELGFLAAQEQKWEDSSRYLDRAVRLDPIDFPQAWYADAVANFNLKRYDAAEKSAREAVKLDPKHVNPRADYLLGLILIEKRDYEGAANELRAYLQLSPNGPDASGVRAKVGELEKALMAAKRPEPEK